MNREDTMQWAAEISEGLGALGSSEFLQSISERAEGIYSRMPVDPELRTFDFREVFDALALEFPRFSGFLKSCNETFESERQMLRYILALCIRDSSARALPAITEITLDTVHETFLSKKRDVVGTSIQRAGIDVGILDYDMAGTFSLPASRTATAQLLLRFLISKLAAQYMSSERLYTHIYIQGGLKGLARELGLREDSEVEHALHEALKAFQGIHIKRKGFEQHGLLMFGLSGETNSRMLKLEVSTILGPDNIFRKNKGMMLVPVPTENPEFVGSPNTWASQSVFQMRLLLLMRTRAVELYQHHGVLISNSDLNLLASLSDMSPSLIQPLLLKWMTGERAFLGMSNEGRYDLIKDLRWAHDMMVDAGEASFKGRTRALRKVAKKSLAR